MNREEIRYIGGLFGETKSTEGPLKSVFLLLPGNGADQTNLEIIWHMMSRFDLSAFGVIGRSVLWRGSVINTESNSFDFSVGEGKTVRLNMASYNKRIPEKLNFMKPKPKYESQNNSEEVIAHYDAG